MGVLLNMFEMSVYLEGMEWRCRFNLATGTGGNFLGKQGFEKNAVVCRT